jgi:5'-AMP-activated protein kinase catalytic alpha subunit
MIAGKKYQGL